LIVLSELGVFLIFHSRLDRQRFVDLGPWVVSPRSVARDERVKVFPETCFVLRLEIVFSFGLRELGRILNWHVLRLAFSSPHFLRWGGTGRSAGLSE